MHSSGTSPPLHWEYISHACTTPPRSISHFPSSLVGSFPRSTQFSHYMGGGPTGPQLLCVVYSYGGFTLPHPAISFDFTGGPGTPHPRGWGAPSPAWASSIRLVRSGRYTGSSLPLFHLPGQMLPLRHGAGAGAHGVRAPPFFGNICLYWAPLSHPHSPFITLHHPIFFWHT